MITENDYSREIVPIQTFSLRKIRFGESVKIDFLSLLFLSDKKIIFRQVELVKIGNGS
tara:strand:+ start:149 stop:322 length:174 start_codon:yes stop_codon:yes gene_type:complete